jgi:hypothetical protein
VRKIEEHAMPNVLMNGVFLGKEITKDRFLKLDLGKVYGDLRAFGACGAPAIIFQRPDGTLGIEDRDNPNLTIVQDIDLSA